MTAGSGATVILKNGARISGFSGAGTLVSPPVINLSPASLVVNEGSSALLSVNASGQEPLAYQWRKNGVDLVGGTASTLLIPSAQFVMRAVMMW